MNYCKDCKYWKPDYSKISNQGNVMYGNCKHPDCKRDGLFRDHRQCRDGSNRMNWMARHSDDRYRTHPACRIRFEKKEKKVMARYLSRLRPIGIGCFPKYDDNKVVEIHNFDCKGDFLEVGVEAWGYIDYEHKIPEADAKHYSFTRIIE